jgi:hypothetical protein
MHVRLPHAGKLLFVVLGTVMIGLTFDIGFSSPVYGAMVQSEDTNYRMEWNVYRVAMQFMSAVPRLSETPGAIRFWYRSGTNYLDSIQSTFLWGFSKSQSSTQAESGMPAIGPSELRLFQDQGLKYLGLLGQSEEEVQGGLQALTGAGLAFELLDHRFLSSGSYHVYWQLIKFSGR